MRIKAFLKTYSSHKRRFYGNKKRRFPLHRKSKKSFKRLSNFPRRCFIRIRKVKGANDITSSNVKSEAQDATSNIDGLIESMSLLKL